MLFWWIDRNNSILCHKQVIKGCRLICEGAQKIELVQCRDGGPALAEESSYVAELWSESQWEPRQFFPSWTKSPEHDHILEIITFLVHVRTPLLKPASWEENPQKIVSFNCKTAAIQRLVTGAYGSISHEFLTCPYFGGIFIAIRYLIMLGFFPRIFHILGAQLGPCFYSVSSCEVHIISKISLVHKYKKKTSQTISDNTDSF